ncbi:MAG: response regulator, partial [Muricauda sp.]|nr:response regulator [Allomuricauda sp.]
MRCIIVEDQPPAQRILRKFIQDVPTLQLVEVFSDGLKAMEFLNTESVDLMFLDIHLPKINGLDFLKSIPNPPNVILTTAFSEYALEGYDLNVVDYLLKPFSFQRFLQAVNKVNAKYEQEGSKSGGVPLTEIYVKSSHEHIKVLINDIYSITSDSDYTEIHLADKKILSNESLRHWVDV